MNGIQQLISDNTISIVLFLVFLVIQVAFFRRTRKKLKKVSSLFPSEDPSAIVQEEGRILISEVDGKDIYNAIIAKINNYTVENKDSIDLGTMKDIVNRCVDKEFEAASSNSALPMYIGLMGTYSGVAYGLLRLVIAMAESKMAGAEDVMFGAVDVYAFIGGVVVAMLTSFCGLILSTISNHYISKVLGTLETDKDKFFNFLQTAILPKMPSTIAQTLKVELQRSIGSLGDTIGGLNSNIGRFSGELKSTFDDLTTKFGDKLWGSIQAMQDVVSTLTSNANAYIESMDKLDTILSKINSPALYKVLTKISTTVNQCSSVSETIETIMSNADSIKDTQEKTIGLQANLAQAQSNMIDSQKEICSSISNLEQEIRQNAVRLHQELNNVSLESQERMNQLLSEPSKFFDYVKAVLEQFATIEKFVESVTAEEFASQADRTKYIYAQMDELRNAGNAVKNYLAVTKSELGEVLEQNKGAIKESAKDFVTSWNRLFNEMTVNKESNPLLYLKKLDTLEEHLSRIQKYIADSQDNSKLLSKLEDIESVLTNIKSSSRSVTSGPKSREIKRRGLFRGIFSRK